MLPDSDAGHAEAALAVVLAPSISTNWPVRTDQPTPLGCCRRRRRLIRRLKRTRAGVFSHCEREVVRGCKVDKCSTFSKGHARWSGANGQPGRPSLTAPGRLLHSVRAPCLGRHHPLVGPSVKSPKKVEAIAYWLGGNQQQRSCSRKPACERPMARGIHERCSRFRPGNSTLHSRESSLRVLASSSSGPADEFIASHSASDRCFGTRFMAAHSHWFGKNLYFHCQPCRA